MALRELLARFGFEVDTKPLDRADAKIKQTTGSIADFAGAFAGAAVASGLVSFTQGLINLGDEIDKTALQTGLSTHDLQSWRFAADRSGASAQELTAAVKILSKNMTDAADGSGGLSKDFAKLGLSVKGTDGKVKSSTEFMLDISDAINKAGSESEKTGIALKFLGRGGAALLPLLKGGRSEVAKLSKRFEELGGGVGEDFVKAAAAAKDAQTDLGIAVTSLKGKLGVALLPTVTAVVDKITSLVVAIRKGSEGTNAFRVGLGLAGTASVVTGAKLAVGLASRFGLIQTASGGATGGILGTIGAMGKLLKMGANVGLKIAIIGLILEDLFTLFTGGKSAIGTLIDGFFGLGTSGAVVGAVKGAFFGLVEIIKSAWPALQFVGAQTKLFLKDMFSGFKGYGKMFSEFFTFLGEDIKGLWTRAVAFILAKMQGLTNSIGDFAKKHPILNALTGNALTLAGGAATGATATAAAVGGAVTGGNVQQINRTIVNVNGAQNAPEVARRVAEAQAEQSADNADALAAVAR